MRRKGRTYRKRKNSGTKSVTSNINFEFMKMLKINGFNSNGLHPRNFHHTGRGLSCKGAIMSGDVIISLPKTLIINSNTAFKSSKWLKCLRKVAGDKDVFNSFQVLIIFLLEEKYKFNCRIISMWNSYILSLPQEYNHVLFCNSNIFKHFSKSAEKKANEIFSKCQKEYKFLKESLSSVVENNSFVITWDLYKWAWCSVNTRCVYCKFEKQRYVTSSKSDSYCLMPFLDLFNHDVNTTVDVGFNKEKQCFEIVSTQSIKKYQQVFINYGPHSNENLFIEYGFVGDQNQFDEVDISASDLLNSFNDIHQLVLKINEFLNYLHKWNIADHWVCSNDGLSWTLSTAIMALLVVNRENSTKDITSKMKNEIDYSKVSAIFFDFDETLVHTAKATEIAYSCINRFLKETDTFQNHDVIRAKSQEVIEYFKIDLKNTDDSIYRTNDVDEIRTGIWKKAILSVTESQSNSSAEVVEKLAPLLYYMWKEKRLTELEFIEKENDVWLKQLRSRYKLVLITNGDSNVQRDKLEATDARKYFDHVIISGDEEHAKPHESIFLKACQLCNVLPKQCIMIGDNFTTDIKGANQLGIPSVLFLHDESKLKETSIQKMMIEQPPALVIHTLETLVGKLT